MTGSIHFRKMNGLGNDFVVLDARARPLALKAAQIAAIADRRSGIGCDQVIALEPSDVADVFMRIWNADGGEVGACGNAARCVAALLVAERGSPHVSIATESGMLAATVAKDGRVTIDMGTPRFDWNRDSAQPTVRGYTGDRSAADRRSGLEQSVGGQCRQPPLHLLRL